MKAVRKRIISFSLVIAMVLSLLPFTSLMTFAEGESSIDLNECIVIGENEHYDCSIYYYDLGENDATIKITGIDELDEWGEFFGLANPAAPTAEGDTITLTSEYSLTESNLRELYADTIDESAIANLDLSNIYGFLLNDGEYWYIFIVHRDSSEEPVVASVFSLDKGEITKKEEAAFDYNGDGGFTVLSDVDLYTVEVPMGTTSIELSFTDDNDTPASVLVYGYDAEGYVNSYAPNASGKYSDEEIYTGFNKAVAKADKNGDFAPYIFVQTPYVGWDSTVLFVIQIVPSYTVSITVNGEEMTECSFEPDAYDTYGYDADYNPYPITVPIYTYNLPKGTDRFDISMSAPGLFYNYAGPEKYIEGAIDDYINGVAEASLKTDANGDGVFDYIQVQKPYKFGGDLLYVITFTSEEAPIPTPAEYSYDYEYGSEYEVMTEARAGLLDDSNAERYYDSVVDTVTGKASAKLDKNLPNSNAKVVLALTASGYDAESVAGYNLVEPLTDLEYAKGSYVTNAAYSLLALDAAVFLNTEGLEAAKDGLVSYLYEALGDNGVISYEWGGKEIVSVDSTAMVLQALAKHYSADDPVIAKAIAFMSSSQKSSGGFTSDGVTTDAGKESTSTTAQVILALAEFGIDPAKDDRFIKLGSSALDYLNAVKSENGFKEKIDDSTMDKLATQQANMALTSLKRLEEKKTAFFDFSDVTVLSGNVKKIRAAIQALSADPRDFTAADTERIEAIWEAFQELSEEDQAFLDNDCSHSGTGQSLGRVLETALWAVWSYDTDTNTTLDDATYTAPTVVSESNKGKSDSIRERYWWVESVEVVDGQATAYIYVTSGAATASKLTSYPSVWIGGKTIDRNSDNNYPIPVDLNGITYFGGISSSMPTPIMYALSVTMPITLTDGIYALPDLKSGPGEMFNHFEADSKQLIVNGDTATIRFITDASTKSITKYSKIALGKTSELVETPYQAELPEGVTIIEGIEQEEQGANGSRYLYEIPLTKREASTLLANEKEDDFYIVIYNKEGSSTEKIPGWYKASSDFYLSLGTLGEQVVFPLEPYNEESMFKTVNAFVDTTGEQAELVFALSGTGYEYVIPGTYYDVLDAQVGANKDTWIKGVTASVNCDYWQPTSATDSTPIHKEEGIANKLQFRVPIEELPESGKLTIPVVAVSQSNAQAAEKADPEKPDYSTAFTARQFVIDFDKDTLEIGNLVQEGAASVSSDVFTFPVKEEGTLYTKGHPTANEYTVELTVNLADNTYDKAVIKNDKDEIVGDEIAITDNKAVLSFANSRGKTNQITDGKATASFHVADSNELYEEVGEWIDIEFEIDAKKYTVDITGTELTFVPLAYDGSDVSFVKSDLKSAFGMWAPQDGSTVTLEGDNVVIHIVPKNTTTYGWMHWGGTNEELTKDVTVNTNGTIDITVETDKCGYAYPVAPIKKKDGGTTSDQYYLTIPTLERLQANEAAAAVVEDMISKLPLADKLTIADKDKVQAALDAYKALSEGAKEAVDNYQDLKLAETVIKLLYVQAQLQELQDKLDRQNERIYGQSRYETSRKVADRYLEESGANKFDNIVVACGTNFPDALGAGYLAKVKDAPILLVGADSEAEIAAYIAGNLAEGGNVYLIGGTGAVSEAFEASISGNAKVKRLFGQNRYETNIAVLEEAGVSKEDILVCTGTGFADSLSATSVGLPILLVGDSLTDAQKEYIGSLESENFYLIGGTGVVKDSIATEIKGVKDGAEVNRIAGANRYATSTEVAKTFFPVATKAVLAYAQNFPDGLSAGSLAIKIGAPVILADSANTSEAAAYVKAAGVKGVITIGGPALISDQAVNTITGR